MFSLKGRAALVTGAGRGIGRQIALKLACAGAQVMITDLDSEPMVETMQLARPGTIAYRVGNLTDKDFPTAIVEATVQTFGSIDIVVNNAGYSWDTVIQKTTDEQFQAMLEIHTIVPFRVLRAAQPHFKEQFMKEQAAKETTFARKVVNVTSIAGTDGNAGQAGYSSGKCGVIGLTKTLAKEFGRYNVTVNAVAFGLIETRMTQPITDQANKPTIDVAGRALPVGVQPGLLEAVKKQCPLGRLGKPEDAANGVLFLCSPLSDYVTGEVLTVSGGFHL